jgi:hypothetical protein
MSVKKRTVLDEDSSPRHVLNYENVPNVKYDVVVFKFDPDNESLVHCLAYVGEDIAYQNTFKRRELSFNPISVIGRGKSQQMTGVSENDTDGDNVPEDVGTALNAIGFTNVPDGDWWIDE